jgi:hypothetical protein
MPEVGRWTSRDPIGEDGGLLLYGFCINNAVQYCDVLGMSSKCAKNVTSPTAETTCPCVSIADAGTSVLEVGLHYTKPVEDPPGHIVMKPWFKGTRCHYKLKFLCDDTTHGHYEGVLTKEEVGDWPA